MTTAPEHFVSTARQLRDTFKVVNSTIGDRVASDDETALLRHLAEAGRIAAELAQPR